LSIEEGVKVFDHDRVLLKRGHSDSLEQTPASRRGWIWAAYAIFAAILLLAFVLASFPYVDTISTVLAPMKLKLVVQDQGMNFPFGARLHGVHLYSTDAQPDRLLLASPEMSVAPGLASLLGQPSLNITASLCGGVVHANVTQRAQVAGIDFAINSVSLAQAELRNFLGAAMSGEVSGSGSALLAGPNIMTVTGRTMIKGRDITITIVNGLAPIRFGTVTGDLSLKNGVVNMRNIEAHGPDGSIEANGEVELAVDPAQSTIKMEVSLAPSADGREHFAMFLNMLPHPPGEGPYQIEGPLMAPTVS
jgi:type II secretion system protein N